jgi:predicted SprT family Zn-dependent metalloprotease
VDLVTAEGIARAMIQEHGLKTWKFEWFPARNLFGRCRHEPSQIIYMSTYLTQLNGEKEFRATMLHEIAHALAGPKHGHDDHWRAIAIRIGDDGMRCYDEQTVTPPARWNATCKHCSKEFKRHRRPERQNSCNYCCPRFNVAFVLIWTDSQTGMVADIHPNPLPSRRNPLRRRRMNLRRTLSYR